MGSRSSASVLELYGTSTCPYTAELREDLEFRGRDFVEYDVENDGDAMRRMSALCSSGAAAVPLLVEDGRVVQVGYGGRSCYVAVRDDAVP
jgi:mycoredoxin